MIDTSTVLGWVGSATSSILGATEIAKNLKQVTSSPEVDVTATKQLVLELLDKLIDAKSEQSNVRDMVLALQRDLKERDQFEADLARYTLADTGRGAVVYRLKPDQSGGEPMHHICPGCVANGKKSILQRHVNRANALFCIVCSGEFLADLGHSSEVMVGESRIGRDWRGY